MGEREGKEKELWLGSRAERGREEWSPWEATLRQEKTEYGSKKRQEGKGGRHQAHSGWQAPSSRRRTTIIRSWIIIRLLIAGF